MHGLTQTHALFLLTFPLKIVTADSFSLDKLGTAIRKLSKLIECYTPVYSDEMYTPVYSDEMYTPVYSEEMHASRRPDLQASDGHAAILRGRHSSHCAGPDTHCNRGLWFLVPCSRCREESEFSGRMQEQHG